VLNDAPSLAGQDKADAEGDGIAEVGIIELNVGIVELNVGIAVGTTTTEDKLSDRGGEGRGDRIEDGIDRIGGVGTDRIDDGIDRGKEGRGEIMEDGTDKGIEGKGEMIEDTIDKGAEGRGDRIEDAIDSGGEGGADRIEDTSDTGVAVITLRIVVVAMDKLGDRTGDRFEVKLSAGERVDTTEGKGGNGTRTELDGINGGSGTRAELDGINGGHTLNVCMTALVIGNVTVAMFVCVRVAEAEVTVLVAAG
jgi:hypothetical protein